MQLCGGVNASWAIFWQSITSLNHCITISISRKHWQGYVRIFTKLTTSHLGFDELWVREILWKGPHDPTSKWQLAYRVAGELSLKTRHATEMELLKNQRYFYTCHECQRRMAVGHGMRRNGNKICHGCATLNHGVVF